VRMFLFDVEIRRYRRLLDVRGVVGPSGPRVCYTLCPIHPRFKLGPKPSKTSSLPSQVYERLRKKEFDMTPDERLQAVS
jgi:hypothetical protein